MERQNPIHTEKTECQDCYKCVRGCPVKAIKVENGSATVMYEQCILCGHCVEICPVGAKKVRDDVSRVRQLLRIRDEVYVSLAPSFRSEFPEFGENKMIGALLSLGFTGVSETALGAEEVSAHTAAFLEEQPGIWISTACPVVVGLIEKYLPEYRENLLPHLSPMLTHAKLLRRQYGPQAGIVFVGPCIAKKKESDRMSDLVDIAITFNDLRTMLEAAGITPENANDEKSGFIPQKAADGRLYPVDGGMIATILPNNSPGKVEAMAFSGISQILKALEELQAIPQERTLFLELLACEGGCVNGPVCNSRGASALKRLKILENVPVPIARSSTITIPRLPDDPPLVVQTFTGEAVTAALKLVGKHSLRDELNCGGCGYESCREFARALLSEKAEATMCVSWMRQLAQKKANALIKTMPSGMVIADEKMNIVECNKQFCEILGEETERLYESKPGLEGASLEKILPFHGLFRTVLEQGGDILDKDIREGSTFFHVSIFTIEPHRYVGGIIQDITAPAFRREQIIGKAKKVIRKNLSTVQQIAYLLGENASETEVMLESIIASFGPQERDQDEGL